MRFRHVWRDSRVVTLEEALPEADVYVTTTGNVDIITAEHMAKMKDQAIVCNIGHFDDEIQVAKLKACKGVKVTEIKGCECPVHKFTFKDGHSIYLLAEGRLVNLGCATGHPSFVIELLFCEPDSCPDQACDGEPENSGLPFAEGTG